MGSDLITEGDLIMNESSITLNQILEETASSGATIGNALKKPWTECKKHMTKFEILRTEIKGFFSEIWFEVLKKTKYRKLFANNR